MVRVCCEIKVSKRARLLCLRAQSTTRAAASSAVCCCSNFEHGGRCDGRPSTGLVPADPDRGGTCPVSRCCGVTTPLAWWRETALWWAAVLWLWVWAVLLEARRATAALVAAHSPFRSFSALPPQLFRITSAAVPHYLRTASALLPHCFRTASALLPRCFRTASTLLPHCFHTASTLLPHCFRTASALLPHCFRTASALLPHCWRNGSPHPSGDASPASMRLRARGAPVVAATPSCFGTAGSTAGEDTSTLMAPVPPPVSAAGGSPGAGVVVGAPSDGTDGRAPFVLKLVDLDAATAARAA